MAAENSITKMVDFSMENGAKTKCMEKVFWVMLVENQHTMVIGLMINLMDLEYYTMKILNHLINRITSLISIMLMNSGYDTKDNSKKITKKDLVHYIYQMERDSKDSSFKILLMVKEFSSLWMDSNSKVYGIRIS